jgi:hypothetical protein
MERWWIDADGENRSTGRKTSPNVTLSPTNLTCSDQGWSWALRGDRLATLGWDLVSVIYKFSPYRAVNAFRFGYKNLSVNAV